MCYKKVEIRSPARSLREPRLYEPFVLAGSDSRVQHLHRMKTSISFQNISDPKVKAVTAAESSLALSIAR